MYTIRTDKELNDLYKKNYSGNHISILAPRSSKNCGKTPDYGKSVVGFKR